MIVELRTFRPRSGVDDAAVVAADHDVQVRFALLRTGIVRWMTARAADGEWLILSLWDSLDAAEAAEAAAASDPAARAFAALVEPGSMTVRRYEDVG